ncbi:MAG: flagellar assembly protein T N-terminal domain-containing protein [Deltaproteobacteria bacterium]|nr:flagellar assembly protein T N-terminal domain-containing protein [Deltaproteobacteria bacterium]
MLLARCIPTAAALLALAAAAWAGTTVEATGEAAIVQDDVPSARLEAIARARWQAVEKVVGVEIKSSSFVNNFVLLDDAVIKRANGVITQSQLLSEARSGELYNVRLRATVEPAPARSALSAIARNRAIAVFLPTRFPDASLRDSHALAEAIISRLTRDGYEVVDLADRKAGISHKELEAAIQRDDYASMRSVLYRFLTNVLLVGTVEFVHTGKRGDDSGFGRLAFEIVTAHVTYRVVGGDDAGLRKILASGHETDKGGGSSVTQATQRAMEELAKSASVKITDEIRRNVRGSGRVRVAVEGVTSLGSDQAVRETLQAIAWVGGVEGVRLGEYLVEYPERPLYLAASLDHKPGFRVTDFTPSSVSARYQAP